MKEPGPGPIDQLDNKLNRWKNEAPPLHRSRLSKLPNDVPHDWQKENKVPPKISRAPRFPILQSALVVAILFFLAMAGIFGWYFFRGGGNSSVGNVSLEVEGPKTVKAGEVAILNLTLVNRNNLPLEFVDLLVEYPPGTQTVDIDNKRVELTRQRLQLGVVKSRETQKRSVKFIMFGKESTKVNIKVSTEYRLRDSNAIFDKAINYAVEITDAPVTLTVSAPEEIGAGQEVTIEVDAMSDSQTILNDPVLLLYYPSGFQFKRSNPSPASGSNTRWNFDSLKPGESKKILIVGILNTQDNEERSFKAEIGVNYKNDNSLGVLYDSDFKTVAIKRSYANLSTKINESTESEYIGNSRQDFRVAVNWSNTLAEPLTDAEVTVFIDGAALDRNTINPADGFYRSSDSSVNWNKVSNPKLASIDPGEDGSAILNFSARSLVANAGQAAIRNPEIDLRVRFRGVRSLAGEDGATQLVENEIVRKIKFNSVIELTARSLYYTGALVNTGPLPPKVGKKTTYTIVWSLANSSNNLEGAKIQASLPIHMEWVGNFTPTSEPLEFVPSEGGGGEVIWNVGSVRAETGSKLPQREVSFQVALTPSLSQIGGSVSLVAAPSFSALDSFTRKKISGQLSRGADTRLISDPGFKLGEDQVVE